MIHWHFEDTNRPRKSMTKLVYSDSELIGTIEGRKDGPFHFRTLDERYQDMSAPNLGLLRNRLEKKERTLDPRNWVEATVDGRKVRIRQDMQNFTEVQQAQIHEMAEHLGITVPTSENPEPSSLQWEQMTAPQGPAIKGTLSVDQLPPNQSPRCGKVSMWARMAPSLPTGDKWAELDMTAVRASQHQTPAKKHGVILMVRSGRVFAQRRSGS